MAEKEASEDHKLNDSEKQKNGTEDSDFAHNMQKCSEALQDEFHKDYVNQCNDEKAKEDDAPSDANDDDEDVVPGVVEFDEEHLKELHKNMSDEQLQELKEKSSTLKIDGNEQYKGKSFQEAINLYTEALNCCPLQFTTERSVLYANRSAAYIGMENNKNAVVDCDKAIDLNPKYLKALLRRAQLHRKMDNLELCLEDYKQVLELDPSIGEARQACASLPGEIHEKNEKLKAEMLGKLKDLGNLVLRPFGLSTENFNMVQDPNTGGYSINFQK